MLRDENADLRAQLETARRPFVVVGGGVDRREAKLPVAQATRATLRPAPHGPLVVVADECDHFEATFPVGPAAATARAALTRWLSGQVPIEVLDDARLLASELISDSILQPDISEEDLLGSRSSSPTARSASRCATRTAAGASPIPGPAGSSASFSR